MAIRINKGLRTGLVGGSLAAIVLAVGFGLPGASALAQKAPAKAEWKFTAVSTPVERGQEYYMATHSFNVFIAAPLQKLVWEDSLPGHFLRGQQMIGNSTPMQHWNEGNGDATKNRAKVAVARGGLDVFTMSPNATMPEPGIDNFADLVLKTNPNARIMVQNSWTAWDGNATPRAGLGGGAPATPFSNADHNKMTVEGLNRLMDPNSAYLQRMRTQLNGINTRHSRQAAHLVPSASAVYALRKEIIAGRVPGVKDQAAIFRDAMGHPATPLANVVTYVWFAAMYRKSPVGMKALIDPKDPTSAARERMLQQIAWNAVVAEPMSGVKGRPVRVGG